MRITLKLFLFALLASTAVPRALCDDGGTPLPTLGPWLLDKNGDPAHWLGHRYQGKKLFEPINVVVVDAVSTTPEQAVAKLFHAVKNSGYELESGHSCGYHGLIGSQLFAQIPPEEGKAFSNAEAFLTNNHGRIMGPLKYGDEYVFVAGFSRESFHLFTSDHHQFVSFNAARDDFAQHMSATGLYLLQPPLDLGNRLNDDASTTADHDGKLVVLRATLESGPAPDYRD